MRRAELKPKIQLVVFREGRAHEHAVVLLSGAGELCVQKAVDFIKLVLRERLLAHVCGYYLLFSSLIPLRPI